MKRKQLNGLLGIVAVALVATVYLSQEEPEPAPPPLTALKQDDINRIAVRHAGKPDIRLEKRDDNWWLVEPVETRAELVEVSALLELSTRNSQRRYAVTEMNLAELELDSPSQSVQLNDVRIDFGGTDPIEAQRYVRLGDTVHLISDPPSAAFDADYNDLVARRLLPADSEITHLKLPGFKLSRGDKGSWLVAPASRDQGADAAQNLVDAWRRAEAMWISKLDGKRPAQGKVEIQAGDERLVFFIIDRKDQLVLSRPELGMQFTLPKSLDSDLFELKPPTEGTSDPDTDEDPHPNPLPEGEGAEEE